MPSCRTAQLVAVKFSSGSLPVEGNTLLNKNALAISNRFLGYSSREISSRERNNCCQHAQQCDISVEGDGHVHIKILSMLNALTEGGLKLSGV